MTDPSCQRGVLVLVASAALFFTANTHRLSLLPFDDCHYAQKGVEMAQRGAFFTVTWGGEANFQHAPLQFWVLGRSFALWGFNDFAARLPSALMALGILVMAWSIGRRALGESEALTGACLLLTTNTFLQNARRCMLEIPTAFWVTAFFLVYLWGWNRPRRLLWIAVPLAGAILTKSVVGLVPIGVIAVSLLRRELCPPGLGWLAAGIGLGVAGGASWTLHQGLVHGWPMMSIHYFQEVGRVAADSAWWQYPIAYPWIVLRWFQPIAFPGLIGAIWVWRSDRWPVQARVLSLWILTWLVVASFSSARYSRYIWPILVPLALLCGAMLVQWSARLARVVRVAVPIAMLVGAAVFWIQPSLLTRDQDADFKREGPELRTLLPRFTRVPLLGEYARRLSNPLVYYSGLRTDAFDSAAEALAAAQRLPRPLVWVERSRAADWEALGVPTEVRVELKDWTLRELSPAGSVTP